MRLATALTLALLVGCVTSRAMPPSASDNTSGTPITTCAKMTCIYVANDRGSSGNSAVTVYASSANGNVKPLWFIEGAKTQLTFPMALAVDDKRNIYVANWYVKGYSESITVYAAGSSGDVAPVQEITGSKTGLKEVLGISVDGSLNIYAANVSPASIEVYAAGATGNAAPIRIISGANTKLTSPFGVAATAKGEVWVANFFSSVIALFATGANGNVKPKLTISGSKTKLDHPNSITFDGTGNVYVMNAGSGKASDPPSITVYKAGSQGNVAPIADITGSKTGLFRSVGIAVDVAGDAYTVEGYSTGSILGFAAGSNGNVAPTQDIKGSKTMLYYTADVGLR